MHGIRCRALCGAVGKCGVVWCGVRRVTCGAVLGAVEGSFCVFSGQRDCVRVCVRITRECVCCHRGLLVACGSGREKETLGSRGAVGVCLFYFVHFWHMIIMTGKDFTRPKVRVASFKHLTASSGLQCRRRRRRRRGSCRNPAYGEHIYPPLPAKRK